MPDRAGLPGRDRLGTVPRQVRARAAATDWRITAALVWLTTAVYLGQLLAAVRFGASVRDVTARLFLDYPLVAWPLSPFLHGGTLHFLANVVMLALIGIEAQRHLAGRQYLGLFLVSAVVSSLVAAATMVPFTARPVASYGISGFVFALAAYLLVHLPAAHGGRGLAPAGFDLERHPLEITAVLFGVSAVLVVSIDVGQAALHGFRGVNGGHLGGVLVGTTAGYLHRRVTSCG